MYSFNSSLPLGGVHDKGTSIKVEYLSCCKYNSYLSKFILFKDEYEILIKRIYKSLYILVYRSNMTFNKQDLQISNIIY